MVSKSFQYLRKNLIKERKDFSNENFKLFMKDTEEDTRRWRQSPMLMSWE